MPLIPKIKRSFRLPRGYKRLKCNTGNYQCGMRCQSEDLKCHKNANGVPKSLLEWNKFASEQKQRTERVQQGRPNAKNLPSADDHGIVSWKANPNYKPAQPGAVKEKAPTQPATPVPVVEPKPSISPDGTKLSQAPKKTAPVEVDALIQELKEKNPRLKPDSLERQAKRTLLERAYEKAKQADPTSAVFVENGDWLEVYGQDAVDIAEKLGWINTSRLWNTGERVKVGGFPAPNKEKYFKQMESAGIKFSILPTDKDGWAIPSGAAQTTKTPAPTSAAKAKKTKPKTEYSAVSPGAVEVGSAVFFNPQKNSVAPRGAKVLSVDQAKGVARLEYATLDGKIRQTDRPLSALLRPSGAVDTPPVQIPSPPTESALQPEKQAKETVKPAPSSADKPTKPAPGKGKNPPKTYLLWATKKGDPDWKESLITETESPDQLQKALKWAEENGFDRIRQSEFNGEQPDFIGAVSAKPKVSTPVPAQPQTKSGADNSPKSPKQAPKSVKERIEQATTKEEVTALVKQAQKEAEQAITSFGKELAQTAKQIKSDLAALETEDEIKSYLKELAPKITARKSELTDSIEALRLFDDPNIESRVKLASDDLESHFRKLNRQGYLWSLETREKITDAVKKHIGAIPSPLAKFRKDKAKPEPDQPSADPLDDIDWDQRVGEYSDERLNQIEKMLDKWSQDDVPSTYDGWASAVKDEQKRRSQPGADNPPKDPKPAPTVPTFANQQEKWDWLANGLTLETTPEEHKQWKAVFNGMDSAELKEYTKWKMAQSRKESRSKAGKKGAATRQRRKEATDNRTAELSATPEGRALLEAEKAFAGATEKGQIKDLALFDQRSIEKRRAEVNYQARRAVDTPSKAQQDYDAYQPEKLDVETGAGLTEGWRVNGFERYRSAPKEKKGTIFYDSDVTGIPWTVTSAGGREEIIVGAAMKEVDKSRRAIELFTTTDENGGVLKHGGMRGGLQIVFPAGRETSKRARNLIQEIAKGKSRQMTVREMETLITDGAEGLERLQRERSASAAKSEQWTKDWGSFLQTKGLTRDGIKDLPTGGQTALLQEFEKGDWRRQAPTQPDSTPDSIIQELETSRSLDETDTLIDKLELAIEGAEKDVVKNNFLATLRNSVTVYDRFPSDKRMMQVDKTTWLNPKDLNTGEKRAYTHYKKQLLEIEQAKQKRLFTDRIKHRNLTGFSDDYKLNMVKGSGLLAIAKRMDEKPEYINWPDELTSAVKRAQKTIIDPINTDPLAPLPAPENDPIAPLRELSKIRVDDSQPAPEVPEKPKETAPTARSLLLKAKTENEYRDLIARAEKEAVAEIMRHKQEMAALTKSLVEGAKKIAGADSETKRKYLENADEQLEVISQKSMNRFFELTPYGSRRPNEIPDDIDLDKRLRDRTTATDRWQRGKIEQYGNAVRKFSDIISNALGIPVHRGTRRMYR